MHNAPRPIDSGTIVYCKAVFSYVYLTIDFVSTSAYGFVILDV